MLHLVDLVISQIVLDRNGLHPDFTDTYQLSVEDLIHGMVNDVARENEALRQEVEGLRNKEWNSTEKNVSDESHRPDVAVASITAGVEGVESVPEQTLRQHLAVCDGLSNRAGWYCD